MAQQNQPFECVFIPYQLGRPVQHNRKAATEQDFKLAQEWLDTDANTATADIPSTAYLQNFLYLTEIVDGSDFGSGGNASEGESSNKVMDPMANLTEDPCDPTNDPSIDPPIAPEVALNEGAATPVLPVDLSTLPLRRSERLKARPVTKYGALATTALRIFSMQAFYLKRITYLE